jgi:serine/threonine-protein kinase
LLDREVALKVLRPEAARLPDAAARFLDEARAAARIDSEHVARVLDVGKLESGLPYMVIELLEGADLRQILNSHGRLPVATVVDYLLQAMQAIACAHTLGIIHRDLTPANLFLARQRDGSSKIKVLDFGLSKVALGGRSTSCLSGSPEYMPPERLERTRMPTAQEDIWSLGVVAYELVTGCKPFAGKKLADVFAAIGRASPLPIRDLRPDVPAGFAYAVAKCLQRDLSVRYSCVVDLARAVAPYGSRAARDSCASIVDLAEAVTYTSTQLLAPAPQIPRISFSEPPPRSDTDPLFAIDAQEETEIMAPPRFSAHPWPIGMPGSSAPPPKEIRKDIRALRPPQSVRSPAVAHPPPSAAPTVVTTEPKRGVRKREQWIEAGMAALAAGGIVGACVLVLARCVDLGHAPSPSGAGVPTAGAVVTSALMTGAPVAGSAPAEPEQARAAPAPRVEARPAPSAPPAPSTIAAPPPDAGPTDPSDPKPRR